MQPGAALPKSPPSFPWAGLGRIPVNFVCRLFSFVHNIQLSTMQAWMLFCASIFCFIVPLWAQQSVFITDFAPITLLAPCASSGYGYAVSSLANDCNNINVAPTAYASCACLKDENSVAVSEAIVSEVEYFCHSTATDDVSSALAVFSSYCAPVTPPATSTTAIAPTTTQPAATPVAYLTNIAAAATGLAPCASSGLSYAVDSITSDCPLVAGPTAQASCACLKDQNSDIISEYIVSEVEYECSSTATEDVSSALGVFAEYCRTGVVNAVTSAFQPIITSIGPMNAIPQLTSLAPCASTAFVDAVDEITSVCNAGAVPTAFANCACANETNSLALSDSIVLNVDYYCSSTATADITSALAIFSSFCVLAGGASGPATAAVTGTGAVTCECPEKILESVRTDFEYSRGC